MKSSDFLTEKIVETLMFIKINIFSIGKKIFNKLFYQQKIFSSNEKSNKNFFSNISILFQNFQNYFLVFEHKKKPSVKSLLKILKS